LAILDVPVQLISVFGDDSDGHWIKEICTAIYYARIKTIPQTISG
jgi:hypothetical protein